MPTPNYREAVGGSHIQIGPTSGDLIDMLDEVAQGQSATNALRAHNVRQNARNDIGASVDTESDILRHWDAGL